MVEQFDAETARQIEQKQTQAMMKRQVIASDAILKVFNWVFKMPLDQSDVSKSGHAVLDHSAPREQSVLTRDVRAPFCEIAFDLQTDDQALKDSESMQHRAFEQLSSANVNQTERIKFSKVGLQQFFEELEKIQIRVDQLNS